jgi:NTP pyrophosphatase (non-canonical NTP hydrolase)
MKGKSKFKVIEVKRMGAPTLQEFQSQVSELLLRHRSLLDVVTKYSQSNASVNRAVTKSITECGCIELTARNQGFSEEMKLDQANRQSKSHMEGSLCEQCREVIRSEMGKNLFYLSAMCNLLDISLEDVVSKEADKCSTLGWFNLT